ncbi:hypothetical protein C9J85_07390 [Haloferax sp. wsp5]|nr:hypothetical protein C9J85_07390 [Haloferax sp. wsp5]
MTSNAPSSPPATGPGTRRESTVLRDRRLQSPTERLSSGGVGPTREDEHATDEWGDDASGRLAARSYGGPAQALAASSASRWTRNERSSA